MCFYGIISSVMKKLYNSSKLLHLPAKKKILLVEAIVLLGLVGFIAFPRHNSATHQTNDASVKPVLHSDGADTSASVPAAETPLAPSATEPSSVDSQGRPTKGGTPTPYTPPRDPSTLPLLPPPAPSCGWADCSRPPETLPSYPLPQ